MKDGLPPGRKGHLFSFARERNKMSLAKNGPGGMDEGGEERMRRRIMWLSELRMC